MLKAILIDFDGTLVDSLNVLTEANIYALRELGYQIDKSELVDKLGMSFDDILKTLISKHPELKNLDLEKFNNFRKRYLEENLHRIKLYKGAIELINFAKDNNLKLAIVSSSRKEYINKVLEYFNLKTVFDTIITADDVKNAKPDPEIFLKALGNLGVKNYESIAIEDSIYGIIAAKRAGIPVYAVLTGVNNKKEIENLKPNGIFKNLYELYLYFKNNLIIESL